MRRFDRSTIDIACGSRSLHVGVFGVMATDAERLEVQWFGGKGRCTAQFLAVMHMGKAAHAYQ